MPRWSADIPIRDESGRVTGIAHVCGSSPKTPERRHCHFCGASDAHFECDFPIGGVDDRGLKKTCDVLLCIGCSTKSGPFDFCPDHCPDCRKCEAAANSDATTPGFFFRKCERHRKTDQPSNQQRSSSHAE